MTPAQRHMQFVAESGCVVCRRVGWDGGRAEVHHVAEGSGLRSDWAVAALCPEHHRGHTGLHGMGTKAFLARYRPPGESEYGLLVWQIEDLARSGKWTHS